MTVAGTFANILLMGLARNAMIVGVVVTALAACGSSVTGGPFSCYYAGSDQSCLAYSCATVDDNPSKCTAGGGSIVTECIHTADTGAIGGCTISLGSREGNCTRTEWDYFGTTSTMMASCAAQDGTFQTP